MGFSVTLSHVIMVIAAVCLASAFSAYAFYTGNVVQSELMQNVSDAKRMTNTQLDIVYATLDNSTVPAHFAIYAKNVGSLPIRDFAYLDLYVGEYCQAQLYSYNQTAEASSQQFNLTDANDDGVWEPRETATLRAYPTGPVDCTVFEARVVPFNGIGSNYLFPGPAA